MRKSMHRRVREAISLSGAPDKEELLRWLARIVASERQSRRDARRCGQLASEDTLTGLLNRRGLVSFFEREVFSSLRIEHGKKKVVFSVAMLDMDGLKRLNDTLGHGAGDKALVTFSKLLKDVFLRKGDIIARYGGDEFVVVFPRTHVGEAVKLLKKFQNALASSPDMQYKGKSFETINLTASIGVTEILVEEGVSEKSLAESFSHALKIADDRMYNSKKSGKNRITEK